MEQSAIIQYIATSFAGVDTVTGTEGIAAGDSFFIYDPDRDLDGKQRFPFATIVTKDYGDFDRSSNLDRPGVFRLNMVSARTPFGPCSTRQPASPTRSNDFAVLDQLVPHPVYAPQPWVSVLNPSEATFEAIKPLLAEAYDSVVRRLTSARERRVRLTRDS